MKPQLISFKLCPFVQRSVIVLREKGVEFDITYIDLKNPPDWFTAISPLGKVPVLRVGDQTLFESAVIMEYLDEVNPPSLHPTDPLRKAINRAWIEFASELFMTQFGMVMAADQPTFEQKQEQLQAKVRRLETQIAGPFFNGETFQLVDAAYAPFFMRLSWLEEWYPFGITADLPKVRQWSEQLLARPSVRESVLKELPELYRGHIESCDGYCAELFGAA